MRIYHSRGAGGVVTRKELLAEGMSRRRIEAAELDGSLVRIDRSRYARADANAEVVAAARADATLTCVSALAAHGLWTMPTSGLHLRRGEYGMRRRELPAGARLCFSPSGPTLKPLDEIPAALAAAIRHHSHEEAVMAMDCVLHRKLLTRAELTTLLDGHSPHARDLLARADSRTESPLESITRQRLRTSGFRPRIQVPVPGLGRVDMMIGRRLIVETDGREFHSGNEGFEEDRRRDRVAATLGLIPIRLTWVQVLTQWEDVLGDIRAIACRTGRRRP
ncbi:endonuclease domain-containing protein [Tessaracoccus sp. G1721]